MGPRACPESLGRGWTRPSGLVRPLSWGLPLGESHRVLGWVCFADLPEKVGPSGFGQMDPVKYLSPHLEPNAPGDQGKVLSREDRVAPVARFCVSLFMCVHFFWHRMEFLGVFHMPRGFH